MSINLTITIGKPRAKLIVRLAKQLHIRKFVGAAHSNWDDMFSFQSKLTITSSGSLLIDKLTLRTSPVPQGSVKPLAIIFQPLIAAMFIRRRLRRAFAFLSGIRFGECELKSPAHNFDIVHRWIRMG